MSVRQWGTPEGDLKYIYYPDNRLVILLKYEDEIVLDSDTEAKMKEIPPRKVQDTCGICCEEFHSSKSITTIMACGHQFDTSCLKEWRMSGWSKNHARCPMCRRVSSALREVCVDALGNELLETVRFRVVAKLGGPAPVLHTTSPTPLDKDPKYEIIVDADFELDMNDAKEYCRMRAHRQIEMWLASQTDT